MYDEINIPRMAFKFGCVLVSLMLLIGMLNMLHSDNEGKRNMTSGYVTNKEIIYHRATYFRDGVTEYILYFEGEYTNAFDKQTAYTRKICVSEETFKHYDIGDYFDSKNLIETDEKEKLV